MTPFKPGKFVNLTPEGVKMMGEQHVLEPRLEVTDKNTQMTEVVQEINTVKARKRKLVEKM